MDFVFRFDASALIGTGHAMRCGAIAEEARKRGLKCTFICEDVMPPWIREYLLVLGEIMTEQEFERQVFDVARNILIIDSYSINPLHYFFDKNRWTGIVSIADHVTPAYFADLYIHPGLDNSWYTGASSKFLFGPRYIPFRTSIVKQEYDAKDCVGLITVFGGGVDSFGFAESICEVFEELRIENQICVFTSRPENFQNYSLNIQLEAFGVALDTRMLSTDLVFTTSSTSSIETAARGIPMGVACSVNNQTLLYHSLQKYGVAMGVGLREDDKGWLFQPDSISALISNKSLRQQIANRTKDFVDLEGGRRIVDAILAIS